MFVEKSYAMTIAFGVILAIAPVSAQLLDTTFTYQGRLRHMENNAAQEVTSVCDFEVNLCAADTGACMLGFQSLPNEQVAGSIFALELDFGSNAFDGNERWLEVAVQCPLPPFNDTGFTTLPRQRITAAPYALQTRGIFVDQAGNVGIGTITPAAQLDVNGPARTSTLEITGGSSVLPPLTGWGDDRFGQANNAPWGTFIAIAAGINHSVAIRSDGTLTAWGSNDYGQTDVPSGTFTRIAAGGFHSVAIRSDGTLVEWGSNDHGQTDVPSGTFISIAAGVYHSLAIRSDSTLVGWGENSFGQTDVPNGTFVAVGAGYDYSLAIRSDGTLAGWGWNVYGQSSVPSGTFSEIAAGSYHGQAIRSDGSLTAWGNSASGQTNVPSGSYLAMAAGGEHGLAIRGDGSLVGWGRNDFGQIDAPAGNFSVVTAGAFHSLALRSDQALPDAALRLHTDSAVKPGSNTWTIFSDRRLKKNIEPLAGALDRLLQLRGVTFQWLDPASQGGITGTQMGLIADEVQRAFPQWVGRDPRGYQTLTVGGFEALTAEALRELRAEKDDQVAELQAHNTELKAENDELCARLDQLEARLVAQDKGGEQ
ncbi:MAG: tail fiber domain-containing protein [Planctomycetota bacterium]